MEVKTFLIYLLVMAGVTYAIRVIPYVCMRKQVKNKFFKSFLGYIPYTVLASMTFPVILDATSSPITAGIGFIVAVIVAYFEKGLLQVAIWACAAVLVMELLLQYVF
ncbi:MAG: AzlD domain-containing protein [Lachnospiraceae bacterium]|nr:AzlD domain-containing protein [Lachnospiraceae bacterium]